MAQQDKRQTQERAIRPQTKTPANVVNRLKHQFEIMNK